MNIRTRPNYTTPHGSQDASLPRATVPKAPAELLEIQKYIRRVSKELVPMATLLHLRAGGDSISAPTIAFDLIAALPPRAKSRRRAPEVEH